MTRAVATNGSAIARPLKTLIPLIKDELAAGDTAGLGHYRRAGEMLLEAKEQVPPGRWNAWVKEKFGIERMQAWRYMRLAEQPLSRLARDTTMTLSKAVDGPRPSHHGPAWQEPIRKILAEHVDVEAVAQERQTRADEQELHRELAVQLVDIGYKALATKLHPDRGGSKEAMTRLNRVRAELKDVAETRRFV